MVGACRLTTQNGITRSVLCLNELADAYYYFTKKADAQDYTQLVDMIVRSPQTQLRSSLLPHVGDIACIPEPFRKLFLPGKTDVVHCLSTNRRQLVLYDNQVNNQKTGAFKLWTAFQEIVKPQVSSQKPVLLGAPFLSLTAEHQLQ